MCDEDNNSWEYYTEMLKVFIAGIIALPKEKKLQSHISDFLHQDSPYTTVSTVVAHLLEFQQEDPMAQTVEKELATPNINVYSGESYELQSEAKRLLHYDVKPCIPENL